LVVDVVFDGEVLDVVVPDDVVLDEVVPDDVVLDEVVLDVDGSVDLVGEPEGSGKSVPDGFGVPGEPRSGLSRGAVGRVRLWSAPWPCDGRWDPPGPPVSGSAAAIAAPTPVSTTPAATKQADAAICTRDATLVTPSTPRPTVGLFRCDDSLTAPQGTDTHRSADRRRSGASPPGGKPAG
jgi:hypothetical protein